MLWHVPEAAWLTTMTEFEGRPLALRVRPGVDSVVNRSAFPRLAIVSHELAVVTSNGLPEAGYNDSLAEFDADVHACFESEGDGFVVLVETFSGERNYYAYVADYDRFKGRLDALRRKYPGHQLSVGGKADPEWEMYNDYRARFPW